jgi:hypothetical protein
MFENWSTPVTNPFYATAAIIVWRIQQLTGHRLNGKWAHFAWEKAVGAR